MTLTFDHWPWPFAWTSLLSLVITPENFMMIRWWEHGEKGVTDGQTDGLNPSYSCLVAAKNKMFSWWEPSYMQADSLYIYIDGLVQERHNPLPTHWSYIFLALNHRYCYCPEGLNLYFSSSSWILNWVYFRLSCCRFFPCFLSFGKR